MTQRDEHGLETRNDYQSLRSPRDFRRVLSDGIRRRAGGLVVVSSPGRAEPPRVGLAVSKSCGSAVTRNRIKRRLRSAAGSIELQSGMDYVIIASPQVAAVSFDRLTGWLEQAVQESADV